MKSRKTHDMLDAKKTMNLLLCFKVNRPKVIHETFDDEVVIINLDSGNYYSFNKAGVNIWGFMESGATVSEIIEGITHRYEGSRVDIENAVNRFLAELQREDIILLDKTKGAESIKGPNPQVEAGSETERLKFEMPILHKYSDMQELILLDPIHDVDETGWPKRNPDIATSK